jgi:CRP/FNR family transcriptional regulator, cyclic AMP receptor protein
MHALDVSPVLAALPERDRSLLAERAIPRRLDAGDILFLAGERSTRVHVLARGVMKLSVRDGSGRETILGLAVAGDLVGELPAIDGLPQPLDAVASVPCDVIGIDGATLAVALGREPTACMELIRAVITRSRWTCETALERTSAEVPSRLAGRLLDLADLIGKMDDGAIELSVAMPQADIAGIAGMCRESACKALKRFRHHGLVEYRDKKLRILRPDLLERVRCGARVK